MNVLTTLAVWLEYGFIGMCLVFIGIVAPWLMFVTLREMLLGH